MTVYVDDWRQRARVGHLDAHWSHLITGPDDDVEELHAFAAGIGLRRTWFQDKPWPHAHYDVTESKRRQAIAAGAAAITWREAGQQALRAIRQRQQARETRQDVRILATGSRRWPDPAAIRAALTEAAQRHPGERLTLVHGKCDPRHAVTGRPVRWAAAERLAPDEQMRLHGGDWLADRTARQLGWQVEQHAADWDAHRRPDGKTNPAGAIRDTAMVKLGAAECVAFIADRSPGVTLTAGLAEQHGIPVHRREVTTALAPAAQQQVQQAAATAQGPAVSAGRDGTGWAEPAYGFRSGPRTCDDPHRGQSGWRASEKSQDTGNGRCRDGHPLAAPLCETTASRLAAAGITPGDPALAFIRDWNATAHARQAEREAGQ